MTLEQLKTLVTIADAGGVLAASEILHKTQPTVSVAIRKLEEELGVQILSRDSYRATLTPAGESLCQQARLVLIQSEKFSELAKHLAQGNEPEVRIAIEASCPMPLVLEILSRCEKKFPGTQFNLMGDTLWGALERLESGEADLAISPWFEENPAFETRPLSTSRLITVAAPQFLERFGKEVLDLSDLTESVQVVVRDSSRNPREQSFGFMAEGRHWYVTDHLTKKEILLAGMGWGRLHAHLIEEDLRTGRLVPLVIRNYARVMEIKICVARMREKLVGPVAQALWEDFSNSPPEIWRGPFVL
ncbi:LysR family transcriptional regulator [Desulfuromonas sp. TF]|uniref:LysR family transcriptional regulator n=1 Tax=Desulfuromonas sp. TF TaxID=1232410 RepID=UPI00041B00F3|nr:LysR family transcriptional regulator [Desulfuromonas sp. TF]